MVQRNLLLFALYLLSGLLLVFLLLPARKGQSQPLAKKNIAVCTQSVPQVLLFWAG